MTPAPSPITKPSRSLSKGREAASGESFLVERALIAENPPTANGQITDSVPPAIKDASLNPSDIDYVNAHGTSTGAGDVAETMALKRVFGDDAKKVWVSSTKSMTGHLLGAAGGLEAVVSVLALRDNAVPPTINLHVPSPECDLDYVPNTAREKRLTHTLSNSFGFGGTNATLIFKKH